VRVAPFALAAALLLVAPATAAADVIFDPADADELAAVLADATKTQNVCYGWHVTVNDVGVVSESIGSNYGAGEPVYTDTCQTSVEFMADITYTSESSESEDSAVHYIVSSADRPTTADLDGLGIDFGELTGENPDVVIAKAVTALPLLVADAGMAQNIEASPETGAAPADAQLTDDPGSDWWRANGGTLMWALILLAASGVFAWWVLRSNRRRRRRGRRVQAAPAEVREEPPTEELPVQEQAGSAEQPDTTEQPGATEQADTTEQPGTTPDESTVDEPAAPTDQKDKE
jgi:hypothetical protein